MMKKRKYDNVDEDEIQKRRKKKENTAKRNIREFNQASSICK